MATSYQFAKVKAPASPAGTKPPAKKQQPKQASGSSDFNSKHPRGAAGSGKGGQFVALSYDSKRNVGTGYGSKQGDKRVVALQKALNRLGLKDKNGNRLVIDGKLGPLTTSSIIAAQKRLGLKPADGKVTPALLHQITTAKTLGGKPGTHKKSNLTRRKKPLKKKPPKFDGKPPLKPPPTRLMPWQKTGQRPPGNYRPTP